MMVVARASLGQGRGEVPLQVVLVTGRHVRVVGRLSLARQWVVLALQGEKSVVFSSAGSYVTSQVRGGHPLLLLAAVAEPDPDYLLLKLQRLGKAGDLLGGRLWALVEVLLQGALD